VVRGGTTDICIEGFPRSANSTSVRLFQIANPSAVIGHHTHTIANLALAVRHGIPAVALLRKPVDAICSSLVASKRRDSDDEFLRYVTLYRWVEGHADSVLLADFDSVLREFNQVIRRVNRRFGRNFDTLRDVEAAKREASEGIRRRYADFPPNAEITNMPLPSESRRALKESWRVQVESHPLLAEAEALHERLLPLCSDDPLPTFDPRSCEP
jgi:hypothetical protein